MKNLYLLNFLTCIAVIPLMFDVRLTYIKIHVLG